jgi:uncharacterized YigZ family protein
MLFDDTYLTIAAPSEGIFKDRGSKFIGFAYPVESEEEIKQRLQELRKEHFNARHHCYAYRLGADKLQYRINDDGEPSGTAGRPIYNQLLSKDLSNILIVVVRYFGGTLLGVPGLINAYKNAALEAIAQAEIIEKIVYNLYRLDFGYLQMNEVMKVIKEKGLEVRSQQFDLQCSMEIAIRKKRITETVDSLSKIEGLTLSFLRTL